MKLPNRQEVESIITWFMFGFLINHICIKILILKGYF